MFYPKSLKDSPFCMDFHREVSEKLDKEALSELRFCSVAVLQSCSKTNFRMAGKIL